jgi:hypothetical protein
MTFEEFFIKKRIDLPALEKAEPSLFSEFKTHFTQMGEQSFDHTKKYWFNKLRRQYHLAPEIKPEKVHIPNPLAEQTITESLNETIEPKAEPKLGFVPKFRAAAVAKPAVEEEKPPVVEDSLRDQPTPKLGFVPKFKAATSLKSAVEEEKKEETPTVADETTTEKQAEVPPEKPAYKPRFNVKNIPRKADE